MPKKKARRPERAGRRAGAAGNRPAATAIARDRDREPQEAADSSPEGLGLRDADRGWLRFLPPSAATILELERPLTDMFREIPADEPMWTWGEDLDENESTEDLVRHYSPHLTADEVTAVAAGLDADAHRARHRRRFTAPCDALGGAEPEGTFADLYQFCLLIGVAEERTREGVAWVLPVPTARNVLEVLPPDSDLASAEGAAQDMDTRLRLWDSETLLYGDPAEDILDLFSGGTGREAMTTSIQRLGRFLGLPEDAARHALAHLTGVNPVFGRSRATCSDDPLTVPAHRVNTVTMDWEAHDIDMGHEPSPGQLAGVECIACGIDYRESPERTPVVAGPAGADTRQNPLIACQGSCAAGFGSPGGTGQPVPPIEDRVLILEQLAARSQ